MRLREGIICTLKNRLPLPYIAGRHVKHILTFQRYAKRRDLLSVLLEDGKEYTMEQVDSLLQNFFKKGKVN